MIQMALLLIIFNSNYLYSMEDKSLKQPHFLDNHLSKREVKDDCLILDNRTDFLLYYEILTRKRELCIHTFSSFEKVFYKTIGIIKGKSVENINPPFDDRKKYEKDTPEWEGAIILTLHNHGNKEWLRQPLWQDRPELEKFLLDQPSRYEIHSKNGTLYLRDALTRKEIFSNTKSNL